MISNKYKQVERELGVFNFCGKSSSKAESKLARYSLNLNFKTRLSFLLYATAIVKRVLLAPVTYILFIVIVR